MSRKGPKPRPAIDRFNEKVVISGGCWLWTGSKNDFGYGWFRWLLDGRMRTGYAHRFAFEFYRGPIPYGLEIDHLCRNHSCANPWHLEPVTHAENCYRGTSFVAENAKKTHCKDGHAFTPENTYLRVSRHGRMRCCRTCKRAIGRKVDAKRRAKPTDSQKCVG